MSYHLLPDAVAVPITEGADRPFLGVSPFVWWAHDAQTEYAQTGMYPASSVPTRRRKGCCICTSHSVANRVEGVMVRRCEGPGCPITYTVEVSTMHFPPPPPPLHSTQCDACTAQERHLCMRHSPPTGMASRDLFVDERQLMEFCALRGSRGSARNTFS